MQYRVINNFLALMQTQPNHIILGIIPKDDTNTILFFQNTSKVAQNTIFLLQENFTVKNLTILIFTFKNDKKCRYKKSDKIKKGRNRK